MRHIKVREELEAGEAALEGAQPVVVDVELLDAHIVLKACYAAQAIVIDVEGLQVDKALKARQLLKAAATQAQFCAVCA